MAQELVPAAKYLRMSTERQHYSSSNQNEVIEKFATRHAFGVVKTYSDEAKSGLSFRKRRGLQKLIEDAPQRKEIVHFTTVREMVNMILAACDGREGNPGLYRDYRFKRFCEAREPAPNCTHNQHTA